MRKCVRCGSEMNENCAIKVEGSGVGIVISKKKQKLFSGRIGIPNVAVCPNCGEISIYIEEPKKVID